MDVAWVLAAVVAAFGLLASLRLALPVSARWMSHTTVRFATHPAWLLPYIVLMGLVVGYMITGDLSPWPNVASARFALHYGSWAGTAMLLVVVTTLLWLLWIPAALAHRFAVAEGTQKPRGIHLLNFLFGLGFIVIVTLVHR